jgi:hypothetical protein
MRSMGTLELKTPYPIQNDVTTIVCSISNIYTLLIEPNKPKVKWSFTYLKFWPNRCLTLGSIEVVVVGAAGGGQKKGQGMHVSMSAAWGRHMSPSSRLGRCILHPSMASHVREDGEGSQYVVDQIRWCVALPLVGRCGSRGGGRRRGVVGLSVGENQMRRP